MSTCFSSFHCTRQNWLRWRWRRRRRRKRSRQPSLPGRLFHVAEVKVVCIASPKPKFKPNPNPKSLCGDPSINKTSGCSCMMMVEPPSHLSSSSSQSPSSSCSSFFVFLAKFRPGSGGSSGLAANFTAVATHDSIWRRRRWRRRWHAEMGLPYLWHLCRRGREREM